MIPVVAALRSAFAAHADPAQAGPMQAYMKSALRFHGIPAPLRRQLQAQAVRAHPCTTTAELAAAMQVLWQQAAAREEWYAAAELARTGPHRRLLTLELLPVFEAIVAGTAWWDVCDEISGQSLPRLLQAHPAEMARTLRRWSRGDELWLRRAAILAQRKRGAAFDAALLYACIEPSLDDARFRREFFITKGIGWALRERSYAAPDEVRAYVEREAARLAPLTVREALKAMRRRAAA